MLRPKRKAQSTAEYVIVLGLIVAAVVAMQTYVKRGFQGRIKGAADKSISSADGSLVLGGKDDQYEPDYLSSDFKNTRISAEREDLEDDGTFVRTIVGNEHSDRRGYQKISTVDGTTTVEPEGVSDDTTAAPAVPTPLPRAGAGS